MTDFSHLHTFVIPAYKESPYLEGCLQSVTSQTAKSSVLITTATPNPYIQGLADKYGVRVITNPNGGGIGKDWNFAFQQATTPYVTLAHQDDVYAIDFTEKHVTAFEKHKSAKPLMAFSRSTVYKDDVAAVPFKNVVRWLLVMPFHFKRCITSKSIKKSILLFSNSISCPGVCYVKSNLPGFTFDNEAKYILDWKAWYDMSQREGAFIYLNFSSHIHREHAESATSVAGLKTLQEEELSLLTQLWGNTFMPKIITKLLGAAK